MAGLKLSILAVVLYVAAFYLRLGYFLPAVYGVGAVLALAVTAPQWRGAPSAVVAATAIALVYLPIQFALFSAMTTESRGEFSMGWHEEPGDGVQLGREIVLEFDDFPGNYVGIYSTEVAEYLAGTGDPSVGVELSVTRDFGCFRGFHETRIGSLTSWATSGFGYFGSAGADRSPWTDPWWCP